MSEGARCGGECLFDPLGRGGGGFDVCRFVARFDRMQGEGSTMGLERHKQLIAGGCGAVLDGQDEPLAFTS